MREISPRIAEAYAGKDSKTITRDVDILAKMGLVSRAKEGVRAKTEIIKAFLPKRLARGELKIAVLILI